MAFNMTLEIDWQLLRDQKRAVLDSMERYGDGLLGGVVKLIEAIQIAGEKAGEPIAWIEEVEE